MLRVGLLVAVFSVFCVVSLSHAKKVDIIFETDMAVDVDDVGALGMLNVLADRGEARILAVMINSSCKDSAYVAHAVNRYHGRTVPIGVYKGRRVDGGKCGRYAKKIGKRTRTKDAKKLYKSLLRKHRNVTIVSVGFLGNLDALVRDRYLRGLVKRKVKQLVLMGGKLKGGTEFNLTKSGKGVAKNVIDKWPGKIVFSTHSIGAAIRTGARMQNAPGASPVRDAYWYYHRRWEALRSSWDQTAVLFAVRGKKNYWRINSRGGLSVDKKGKSRWKKNLKRDHSHLKPQMSNSRLAKVIDDLMMTKPR